MEAFLKNTGCKLGLEVCLDLEQLTFIWILEHSVGKQEYPSLRKNFFKKTQAAFCISRTILCSPSLNCPLLGFPVSQPLERNILLCCFILFYFWPSIWPRFFILVLFSRYLLICYFSPSPGPPLPLI